MSVETILSFSKASADQALRVARSARGYPLCGHQEWLTAETATDPLVAETIKVAGISLLATCVLGRGHEDSPHPTKERAP